MQLLAGKLHPRLIQEGVGIDDIRFFYQNESGREALVTEWLKKPAFSTSLELGDRALLLSPNNLQLYANAFAYHFYLQNEDKLKGILNQLKSATFDHSDSKSNFAELLAGEHDTDIRQSLALHLEQQRDLLRGLTEEGARQHAQILVTESLLSSYTLGESIDYDKEISLIRAITEKAPSLRTTNALVRALSQQACLQLAKSSPEFKKLVEDSRRYLDAETLLTLGLTSDTLRPLVLANTTAKEALLTKLKSDQGFSSSTDASRVILTQHLKPTEHAHVLKQFQGSSLVGININFLTATSPWHPQTLIAKYLYLKCQGKTSEASKVLEKIRQSGLNLP